MNKYIAWFFSLLCNVSFLVADVRVNIDQYLPKSAEVTGVVHSLGAEPGIEELSKKMALAVQANQTWMQGYLKQQNLKPGESLPYHPNLGLSESEYKRLLAGMKKLELIVMGEIKLRFEKVGEETVIHSEGMELALNGFSISPTKNFVKTHLAKLDTHTTINQNNPNSPLGVWTGDQWKKETQSGPNQVFSEKLAIGRRAQGNQGILYYDLKSTAEQTATHFVVLYPLE